MTWLVVFAKIIKFAVDRELPRLTWNFIYIHDTGAHGFSMGYNYNRRLRSARIIIKEDGSVEMIRRAETPADYFATFDFFRHNEVRITVSKVLSHLYLHNGGKTTLGHAPDMSIKSGA